MRLTSVRWFCSDPVGSNGVFPVFAFAFDFAARGMPRCCPDR